MFYENLDKNNTNAWIIQLRTLNVTKIFQISCVTLFDSPILLDPPILHTVGGDPKCRTHFFKQNCISNCKKDILDCQKYIFWPSIKLYLHSTTIVLTIKNVFFGNGKQFSDISQCVHDHRLPSVHSILILFVKIYVFQDFCLIWFFTFHQQSFSYIKTGFPGLNQY